VTIEYFFRFLASERLNHKNMIITRYVKCQKITNFVLFKFLPLRLMIYKALGIALSRR